MPAIITQKQRILNSDFFQKMVLEIPTYVYIGGVTAWDDEEVPPDIKDSALDIIGAYDGLVGVKRIVSSDVISVLPRIDWVSGGVFDEYDDEVDLVNERNPETDNFYRFYVITDEFNVYKCLSNSNREQSTTKPSGTSVNAFQTSDGYIWKYMYTVSSVDAFKFMTLNWIPCYTLFNNNGSSQWNVQEAAVDGTIEHAKVTNGGAGYLSSNPPTVTVTGDGTGATAAAIVDDNTGEVTNIILTTPGSGYTTATISITDGDGTGATATPVLSPKGGHGKDARGELGATYKMVRVVLEEEDSDIFPTDTVFRRAGIIKEPRLTDTGVMLNIEDVSLYQVGEDVTQETTNAQGTIASIDPVNNLLYLNLVSGTFNTTNTVSSQAYNVETVLNVAVDVNIPVTAAKAASADIEPLSGDLLYFSTREKIERGLNQREEIRFIISF